MNILIVLTKLTSQTTETPTPSTTAGPNILINGGFEDGFLHWLHYSSNEATGSIDTTYSPQGENHVLARVPAGGTKTHWVQLRQTLPAVIPGRAYAVDFLLNHISGKCGVQVYFIDMPLLYARPALPPPFGNVWRKMHAEAVLPPFGSTLNYLYVDVNCEGTGAVEMEVRLDHFRLYLVEDVVASTTTTTTTTLPPTTTTTTVSTSPLFPT